MPEIASISSLQHSTAPQQVYSASQSEVLRKEDYQAASPLSLGRYYSSSTGAAARKNAEYAG
jgi:hypothetical protein